MPSSAGPPLLEAAPRDLGVDGCGAPVMAANGDAQVVTTPGAFDESLGGFIDGYLLKLTPDLSEIVFGTYLGGGPPDACERVVVGPSGVITVVGTTRSEGFPVTPGALQTEGAVFDLDAYVARLSPDAATQPRRHRGDTVGHQ